MASGHTGLPRVYGTTSLATHNTELKGVNLSATCSFFAESMFWNIMTC